MSDNNSNPANSGYPPQYIHPNFEFNQQSNLQSEGSISNYLFPGRAEQQENLFSPYQGYHQGGTNDTRNVLPSMQQFGVNPYQSYGIPQEHPQPIPREFINTIDRKASNERNDIPGGGPHSTNNSNNNNNYEHTNGVHVTMRGNVPQGAPSGNGPLSSHMKSNIPTGPTQTMPHGNQTSIQQQQQQQQQSQHHQPPHTRGVPTLPSNNNNNYALEKASQSPSSSSPSQQQQSHPGAGYLYGAPQPDPSKLHHQISKSGDNSNSNNNNGLIDPSEMPRHIVNSNNIVNSSSSSSSSNHHPSSMQSTNQSLHSNINNNNNQSISNNNNNNNGGGSPTHLTNSSSSSGGGGGSGGDGNYNSIVPFQESNQHYCDITEFLNMPQIEAAKKLQIPPSTLSKRWKEAARNRKWPWRTVRKIDKEITTLLHNVPPGASIPEDIEANLACLLKKRQEELKPTVIRL